MLGIIKNHFEAGRQVKKYAEIEPIVEEMQALIDNGIKKGNYDKGFALSHCQVSRNPYAFFVVGSAWVGKEKKDGWPAAAIINPQILEVTDKIDVGTKENPDMRQNVFTYDEACFSFPFRQPKKVKRYYRITVQYQIKGLFGLKTVVEEIEELRAHIFQHEFSDCLGENIYWNKKK